MSPQWKVFELGLICGLSLSTTLFTWSRPTALSEALTVTLRCLCLLAPASFYFLFVRGLHG